MHAFGISLEQRRLVADDLLQAGAADDLESVARAGAGNEIDRRGFHRRALLAVEQLIAAFRLALERELGRQRAA